MLHAILIFLYSYVANGMPIAWLGAMASVAMPRMFAHPSRRRPMQWLLIMFVTAATVGLCAATYEMSLIRYGWAAFNLLSFIWCFSFPLNWYLGGRFDLAWLCSDTGRSGLWFSYSIIFVGLASLFVAFTMLYDPYANYLAATSFLASGVICFLTAYIVSRHSSWIYLRALDRIKPVYRVHWDGITRMTPAQMVGSFEHSGPRTAAAANALRAATPDEVDELLAIEER